MDKFSRRRIKKFIFVKMEFINPPNSVFYKDVVSKNFCLAPSKYSKFIIPNNQKDVSFHNLSKITSLSEKRQEIKKKGKYTYIEIGDINIYNGDIDYKEYVGFYVPQNRPLILNKDDIIISKVRTYRKGIAFVTKKGSVCTPAFLVIRNIDKSLTKEYLYAILRSNFFVEQILSFQNRGMYPRLDKDTSKEVLIPKPKNNEIIKFITNIVKIILSKEDKIKTNFVKINKIIEEEILLNQKQKKNYSSNPNYNEILKKSRIDTGIYNKEYKGIIDLIKNYSKGFFTIPSNKFKSGSTPKDRIIGKGTKKWITPSIISKYGNLVKEENIICKKNNISKDCILIINRTSKEGVGEYVGISTFYDFEIMGLGHHNQGCYRIEDFSREELIFITLLLNSKYYRKLCGNISMGSKMKEIKITDFAEIPFPNFDKTKRDKLIFLYNSEEGILKLSKQVNQSIKRIEDIVSKMIKGEPINLDNNFSE